jgi:hypothetical protein
MAHIFCKVDDALGDVRKQVLAKLYPSEVVTTGILFALKGGHFQAFYHWLIDSSRSCSPRRFVPAPLVCCRPPRSLPY